MICLLALTITVYTVGQLYKLFNLSLYLCEMGIMVCFPPSWFVKVNKIMLYELKSTTYLTVKST